ncbi:HlyD family secretion protein [Undibacter mobilis]|uniref:HlyD family secretion protein n=1 Tax=Undibacter mobilis TaxID=2292256 RepID=A0A371B8D0_9BRAD|nr:HlyD family secretion protein [Undibacter mobilis]RDV03856.1 HlyD family secretion protein [Undibacter mobilis]
MSDKVLKVVPAPEAKSTAEGAAATADTPAQPAKKRNLRRTLLIVLPLAAALIGGVIYLMGGRYISTDNAYVGAQKVLITPDVSGKVMKVAVHEGQHVNAGDELLMLDRVPFELALAQAKAKLAIARSDYDKAKANLASLIKLSDLAERNVELKQRDLERKQKLVASQAGSAADVDTSAAAVVAAQLQAQYAEQQRDTTLASLLGDANLPLEKFPAYTEAKAVADNAERDLAHTTLRAPIDGTATQVDNIQLGRFVAAGAPIFSVIDDANPWVDANPKETDITYLRLGQKATLDIDSFPDRAFTGTVIAVSPGTGSQFSILPAQNATGNWVKVVQRVPVRIAFDKGQDLSRLRTGMSANIAIDTHYSRIPFMSHAEK